MSHRKPDTDVARLWVEFKKTADQQLRNRLMERYLPLVRHQAERIYARLPSEVEYDDLVSAGVFGLMDAIDAFDLSRGVKFETYCIQRIRGAIFDELRNMDWVPRLVRNRLHKLDRASTELHFTLGRRPTDAELAERLEMAWPDYAKLRREATAAVQVSLSRKYEENDSQRDLCEIDVLVDRRGRDPLAETQKRDLKEFMSRGLTRAERLILILYYYEELTMKEIGATLALSESRVSQLHSTVMGRLRSRLAPAQLAMVS